MNQLTVRGFDDELADRIRRLAKRDGTSLNQAALKNAAQGSRGWLIRARDRTRLARRWII